MNFCVICFCLLRIFRRFRLRSLCVCVSVRVVFGFRHKPENSFARDSARVSNGIYVRSYCGIPQLPIGSVEVRKRRFDGRFSKSISAPSDLIKICLAN